MNLKTTIAFWLYFLVGLLLVAFGVVYMLRTEFMPYHAVAVGMPWAEVPPNVKVLILTLIKAVGGTTLALAIAFYAILFLAFRQDMRWAIYAMALLGLVQSAATFYSMGYAALNTPANPPFWAPAVGLLLTLIAFMLSVLNSNQKGSGHVKGFGAS